MQSLARLPSLQEENDQAFLWSRVGADPWFQGAAGELGWLALTWQTHQGPDLFPEPQSHSEAAAPTGEVQWPQEVLPSPQRCPGH